MKEVKIMEKTMKITKAMVLATVKANIKNMVFDGDVTAEDVLAYCDTTVAQIAAKAEKNKERAAEKRKAGDELRAQVLGFVTEEWQTRDEIAANFEDEDVTPAKVGARLTQLVADGVVVKEKQRVDGKDKMFYALASDMVLESGEGEDAE